MLSDPPFPTGGVLVGLTMELSISCNDCGERFASASNIASQTPSSPSD